MFLTEKKKSTNITLVCTQVGRCFIHTHTHTDTHKHTHTHILMNIEIKIKTKQRDERRSGGLSLKKESVKQSKDSAALLRGCFQGVEAKAAKARSVVLFSG